MMESIPPCLPVRRREFPLPGALEACYGRIELDASGVPTERWRRRTIGFVRAPWPFHLSWRPEQPVRRLACHRALTGAFGEVLSVLADEWPSAALVAAGLDQFGGSFFFAVDRDPHGVRLSPHCWGAAFLLPGLSGSHPAALRALELFQGAGWSCDPGAGRVAAVDPRPAASSSTLPVLSEPAAAASAPVRRPSRSRLQA